MQRALFTFAVLACTTSAVFAEGWGTLKGRFIYDGAAPKQGKITPTKDQQFCGKHEIPDESLVVDSQCKGIANVIVSLYIARGAKAPEAHPDYAKAKAQPVTIDNQNCRFEPHITVALAGQPVILGNKDAIPHNTKIDFFANSPINPLIPANGNVKQTFTSPESLPSPVSCSIHPWMQGYLFIQDHPYVAVTSKDGSFEIKNVPAGKLTFRAWQEKAGYLADVKVGGKSETWRRGQFERTIENGKTLDLGEIVIGSAAFNKK
jgi:hypothetical protein